MSSEQRKPLILPLFAPSIASDRNWFRLDQLADVIDCPHSTPELIDDPNAPLVVRSQDMRSGTFMTALAGRVSEETYKERISRAEPQFGDLLYSREGTYFGIAAEVPPGVRVCLGQRMVLIRPKADQIDHRFLRHWLNSPQIFGHIHGFRDGTVAERLNLPTIRGLAVALPALRVQQKVGEILGALDDRITLLRETNATLEAIAQALFKSWFVDFDPVRAKAEGRQPDGMDAATADLFPNSFEESELGLVPKGWRSGKFTDVIVESGVRVGTSESVVLSAVQTGHLVRSDDHFNKKVHSSDIRKYKRVAPLSFAYNPSRINIGSIGINEQGCLGAVSPIYVVFSPLDEPTGFLIWHHLRTERVRSLVRSLASGTVRQSVSFSDFASIPLVVPDQSVLDQFSLNRAAVYKKIETNKNQAQTLTQIRDTLLPRLISGQLRLPDVQGQLKETLP